jgi:putative MATE family efflux protein
LVIKEKILPQSEQLHQSTERMGTDPLGKLLLRLSLPSIGSMVVVSLYNLVNTFWVARLGYQAVAALTVVMPFFVFCMAVGAGTGVGVNALSSRRFGERNTEAANHATGQAFFLALVIGLLFILLTNLFPRQILTLCGATPDILDLGEQYLTMFGLGMPLFFFSLISRNIYHASGDTLRPMIFTLIAQVCNVILDPFLIFGWWIFPEMGVRGAGLATVISSGIGGLLALFFILRGKTAYKVRLHHCFPDFSIIKAIYRVGFPSMLMEATESVVFALFNNVAAGFGSLTLAALGIAMRVSDLAFMPIIGTAHGMLPIIGYSLGAGLRQRLWRTVKLAAMGLVALMIAATIFVEVFTPQLIRIFNSDPGLVAIAVPGMRIFCSSLALIGPTIVFITTFQGLSKGKDAMFLSFARQFIFFIPGLFILSHFFGLNGVWISMPISDTMGTVTSSLWLWREYHLQKKMYFPSPEKSAG